MDKNNFTVEDVYELAVTMSEKGEYNEAFKCYSYTAERGHLSGQFNLAYCYFYGEGTAVNYKEAIKWWTEASKQRHEGAIKN